MKNRPLFRLRCLKVAHRVLQVENGGDQAFVLLQLPDTLGRLRPGSGHIEGGADSVGQQILAGAAVEMHRPGIEQRLFQIRRQVLKIPHLTALPVWNNALKPASPSLRGRLPLYRNDSSYRNPEAAGAA
ncbi:hypothetical protein D3C76_1528120 [compost metagenome]